MQAVLLAVRSSLQLLIVQRRASSKSKTKLSRLRSVQKLSSYCRLLFRTVESDIEGLEHLERRRPVGTFAGKVARPVSAYFGRMEGSTDDCEGHGQSACMPLQQPPLSAAEGLEHTLSTPKAGQKGSPLVFPSLVKEPGTPSHLGSVSATANITDSANSTPQGSLPRSPRSPLPRSDNLMEFRPSEKPHLSSPPPQHVGMGESCTLLRLLVPPDFDLEKAVVSYGFFMAAPNRWLFPPGQETGCLERPLRLVDGQTVWVRIGPMTRADPGVLPISVAVGKMEDADEELVKVRVHAVFSSSMNTASSVWTLPKLLAIVEVQSAVFDVVLSQLIFSVASSDNWIASEWQELCFCLVVFASQQYCPDKALSRLLTKRR